MPSWNTRFWKKSVEVESIDGPSRTAGAVAGSSRHAASILSMHDRQLILSSDTAASRYKYGVQVLYDPGSEVAVFDIVFVHGLTGSRLSTWTNKGSKTLWPETFLSNDISNTRILTLGYDADVVNAWASASQNRVGDHANDLNNALCDLRSATKTTNRPIIFVAHSLGGIVVKDALLTSKNDEKPHIREIYDSTKAIAFLGTPHRGANLANWAAWIGRYTNIMKKTNQDIIKLLRPQSEVHERINQNFHRMLLQAQPQRRPLEIVCFFEELPIQGVGEIVPKDSAILLGYEFRGIHANHMDMTKFEDNQDPGYQSLCAVLLRWMTSYEEFLYLNPNLSTTPSTEETARNRPIAPSPTNHQINNTGGGHVVQGNTVLGSMNFGR